MTRAKSVVLAAAVVLAATAPAAADYATVVTDLHFRAGPGPGHPSLGVFRAGTTIPIEDCYGGWCLTRWGSRRGFVSEAYLDFRGPLYAPRAYVRPAPPPTIYYGPRVYYEPWPHHGYHYYYRRPHSGLYFYW